MTHAYRPVILTVSFSDSSSVFGILLFRTIVGFHAVIETLVAILQELYHRIENEMVSHVYEPLNVCFPLFLVGFGKVVGMEEANRHR